MANVADILKQPYARMITPEGDGSFRAEILEFPGCIALADTASNALASLEEVATSWLEATIEQGLKIPSPMEQEQYSGKFVVRLPKSLHRKAAQYAKREGVSLNQYMVTALAVEVGAEERKGMTTGGTTYAFANFSPHGNQMVALIGAPKSEGAPLSFAQLMGNWKQFNTPVGTSTPELANG